MSIFGYKKTEHIGKADPHPLSGTGPYQLVQFGQNTEYIGKHDFEVKNV